MRKLFLTISLFSALLSPTAAQAQNTKPNNLAYESQSDLSADLEVEASPKNPWNEYPKGKNPPAKDSRSGFVCALLWLPNRIVDLWDIFRIDVGVGPSLGAVVRVSEYAQFGYREMNPLSLRVGLMGRQSPIILERSNEMGFGPGFIESKDREVCRAEIGLGVDPIIFGLYGGICLDEAYDFLSGFWGGDFKDDDF